MKCYLYAFAAGPPGDLPRGVGARPLFVRSHRGVWILASDWEDGSPPPTTTPDILAHEAVVEAAMCECAVLPCRFGTIVAEPVCLEFIENYAKTIRARLEQVSGQIEVSVKVFDPLVAAPAPQGVLPRSGAAYLLEKRQEVHREQERAEQVRKLVDQIDVVFAPWTTDRHPRLTPTGGVLAALTYLIPKRAMGEWADAAARLRESFPGYDFLATGPWPPYHFAEVTSHGGGDAEPDFGVANKP